MNKYIVIGLIFALSNVSYAAQVNCTLGSECNINHCEYLKEYVDLALIRDGHHEEVFDIIRANPEQASRLRALYKHCNSPEELTKKLYESADPYNGSLYLIKHATSAPLASCRDQIDEYDQLIVEMELDRHMNYNDIHEFIDDEYMNDSYEFIN